MKRFMTKKVVAIGLTAGLLLGGAGVAFAYFISTGGGSGTASVGNSATIQLSSPLVGSLYPGAVATPVTVTIHNPGTGTEEVGTISGTVTTQSTCLGSWFIVAPIVYNTAVAGGASPTVPTTVAMSNEALDQSVCEGLTMAIVWSSN